MSQSDGDWYLVGTDGSQQGPHSRASLLAMYAAGSVTSVTLVWAPGLNGWQSFGNAFHGLVPPPVPPDRGASATHSIPDSQPASPPLDQSNSFLGGAHHPWRRYFAKLIDIWTLGFLGLLLLVFVIGYLNPSMAAGLASALSNPILAGLAITAVWIPIEAVLLSVAGNTPARWLYGISIRSIDGTKLGLGKAFERTIMLTIQGMGGGIPIVAFFTQIFAYRRLTKSGTTLWDIATNSVVSHKQWGPIRAFFCVVAAIAWLLTISLINSATNAN